MQESLDEIDDQIQVGSGIGDLGEHQCITGIHDNRKSVQFVETGSNFEDKPITVEIQAQFSPTLEESPTKIKKRWEAKLNKRKDLYRQSTVKSKKGSTRPPSPETINKEIYRNFIASSNKTSSLIDLQS